MISMLLAFVCCLHTSEGDDGNRQADESCRAPEPRKLHEGRDGRETAARFYLQTTSVSLRDSCEGEATAGGFQSYVDLLTCIQMTHTASASQSASPLRGAGKNRIRK